MISTIWQLRRSLVLSLAVVLTTVACAPITPSGKGTIKPRDDTDVMLSRDLSGTLVRARMTGKPTVVVFSAAWCPHCQAFETTVLSSPQVRALSGEFYWVLVNIDRQASIARNYNVDAVPQILLLDATGRLWKRLINVATEQRFRHYLTAFAVNLEKTSDTTSLQSQTRAGQLCRSTANSEDVDENSSPLQTVPTKVCTVN